jgi:phosphoketolase
MRLQFRPLPGSDFEDLSELQREQLGPLLEQAESDGEGGAELIERFDVLDDHGQHVYDLHLFCGEDGQLHKAGTLEYVASFSQGAATGRDDESLLAALDAAYEAWATARRADRKATR